jgi:hypothetical protein
VIITCENREKHDFRYAFADRRGHLEKGFYHFLASSISDSIAVEEFEAGIA